MFNKKEWINEFEKNNGRKPTPTEFLNAKNSFKNEEQDTLLIINDSTLSEKIDSEFDPIFDENFNENKTIANDKLDESLEYSIPSSEKLDESSEYSIPSSEKLDESSEYSIPSSEKLDESSEYSIPSSEKLDESSEYSIPSREKLDESLEHSIPSSEKLDESLEHSIPNNNSNTKLYCQICGSENTSKNEFCVSCGNRISNSFDAKSFFSNITSKISDVGFVATRRTKEITKNAQVTSQIYIEKKKRENLIMALGNAYFEKYKDCDEVEFNELMLEIDSIDKIIAALKNSIS